MAQGFLEQEARKANKKNRIFFTTMLVVYICLVSILVVALKDSIDFSDYRVRKIAAIVIIISGIMLISVAAGLIRSVMGAGDGKSLILPFQEDTKKVVGEIIDREIAEGKILVDEYMEAFSEEEKPHGERVILLPSYMLLINSMGRVFAIPRNKIYWVCVQTGIKGRSSYRVRLMVFTEKKIFCQFEAIDIEHVKEIAEKIYQYIPNVFCNYDTFQLSYQLDKLFDKNREEFVKFYEQEKKKHL